MPAVRAAHVNLHIGADERAPTLVPVYDHHNGGRVATGDLLVVMQERLGLGVTLSGRAEDLIGYLEGCIAMLKTTQVALAEVA